MPRDGVVCHMRLKRGRVTVGIGTEGGIMFAEGHVSRRQFVGGAAIAGAAMTAGSFVRTARAEQSEVQDPCATYLSYENPDEIGVVHQAQAQVDADFVVVGSGIGGLTAAMLAAELAPAAKIVLGEKCGFTGGTGNYAEICAPAAPCTPEEAAASALAKVVASNYMKDFYLLERLAFEGNLCTSWLLNKHGVELDGSHFYYQNWAGATTMAQLTEEIATSEAYANVEILLNTRATALLMADGYTCQGVQVFADGVYTDIVAKAVFLCTGGMATNFDLLRFFTNQDVVEKSYGMGAGQDGDGHLMVQQTAHGMVKSVYATSMFNNVKGFGFSSPLGVAAVVQPTCLYVNQYGERFCDEAASNVYPFMLAGKAIETNGRCYSIVGQNLIDRFASQGSDTEYWFYYQTPTDLQEDLERYADNPGVFKAETLEELAVLIDVDPTALCTTVERYEADAEAGEGDTVKGKDAQWMVSLGSGPYYAFRMSSGIIQTNGGIRVDRRCRVCDPYFKPVNGLYAGGIAISGLNVEYYSTGTSQAAGLWSGTVVAREVVENVLGMSVPEDWYGERYTGPFMDRGATGKCKPLE